MSSYSERKSWNNDGMDPDWKPNLNFTDGKVVEPKKLSSDDQLLKAQALSDELGITDLLKLRDHVENKIKEIYQVKQDEIKL